MATEGGKVGTATGGTVAEISSIFQSILNQSTNRPTAPGSNVPLGDYTVFTDDHMRKMTEASEQVVKGSQHAAKSMSGAFTESVGKMVSGFIDIAKDAFRLQKTMLDATRQAMGGLDSIPGAMDTMISGVFQVISDKVKNASFTKALGEVQGMLSSIMHTAMGIFRIGFMDAWYANKAKWKAMSIVGGPEETRTARGAEAAAATRSLYRDFTREEAEQWANSMLQQGARLAPKLTDMMVRAGMSMGLDAGKMGQVLDVVAKIKTSSQNAADMIESSFRAARAAAEDSADAFGEVTIPATQIHEMIMKASQQARFLNVDMSRVATTMQFLTKNQEKFRAAGVSIREDGGKILTELTAGTQKWTDAIHVFFGMKGGVEGSPMEGWAKSKFGEGFVSGLRRTGEGGFTAGAPVTEDKMMSQRLDVIKSTMMEAAKGAHSDAEALFIQMKVAEETFGMSEETARVLALSGKDDLKKLAENPKLADQFKSQKEILSDLKSYAAVSQNVERQMASLAAAQLIHMIAVATNTTILAGIEAGLIDKDSAAVKAALTDSAGALMRSNLNAATQISLIMGNVLNTATKGEFSNLTNAIQTLANAAGVTAKKEEDKSEKKEKSAGEKVQEKVNSALDTIKNKVSGLWPFDKKKETATPGLPIPGKLDTLTTATLKAEKFIGPGKAGGGTVGTDPTNKLVMVGEAGPELVAFGKAGTVIDAMTTRGILDALSTPSRGGSTIANINVDSSPYVFNITISGGSDKEKILTAFKEQVLSKIS